MPPRSDRPLMYHSAIAALGPVRITVEAEPRFVKSKGKYVVDLTVKDEKVAYWAENDECAHFFDGQKGRTFTIIAEGSREQAVLTYVGEASGATPVAPGRAMAPPPPPATPTQLAHPPSSPPTSRAGYPPAPPKKDKVDRYIEAVKEVAKIGTALQLAATECLKRTMQFCKDSGVTVSDELASSFVSRLAEEMTSGETVRSFLVSLDRGHLFELFPTRLDAELQKAAIERVARRNKEAATAPPPPPPPPQPAPAPAPVASVEEDDVPF